MHKTREGKKSAKAEAEAAKTEAAELKARLESANTGTGGTPVQVSWDPLSHVISEAQLQQTLDERRVKYDADIDYLIQNAATGYDYVDRTTGERKHVEPEEIPAVLASVRAERKQFDTFEKPARARLQQQSTYDGTVQARYPKEMLGAETRKAEFKKIFDLDPVIGRHPRHNLLIHDSITMDAVRAGEFQLVRKAKKESGTAQQQTQRPAGRSAPLSLSHASPPASRVNGSGVDLEALRDAAAKGDKTAQSKIEELFVFGATGPP
jgi:hypothetical protein